MSLEEKKLNEDESLKLITEMIGKAKSSYHSNGTGAMMWGVVIFFCSMVDFFKMQFHFDIGFDIWWLMWAAHRAYGRCSASTSWFRPRRL